MRIFMTALRIKKINKVLIKNNSPYFQYIAYCLTVYYIEGNPF